MMKSNDLILKYIIKPKIKINKHNTINKYKNMSMKVKSLAIK